MGMTVQELIDELMKVDKPAIVHVIKGDAGNSFVCKIIDIEWYGDYPVIVI